MGRETDVDLLPQYSNTPVLQYSIPVLIEGG
ncbi:MAG: hypothetical protein HW373_680 [Deltaproteobacteria bacterium]|jgi:hypothetical protein|nr:hypothetical protein [Deltaproteobacteria bacterium]